MAEGTYEYECMRAELLGVEKPNQEEFEEKMKLQKEAEEEEHLTEQMKEVDLRDEQLHGTGGKIDELNKMFSVTQQRISKFKNVYGSIKGLLNSRPSTPSEGCSSNDPAAEPESNTINDALDTLDTMKDVENASDANIAKSAVTDLKQKMTCKLGKLDSLLFKTDSAADSIAKTVQ